MYACTYLQSFTSNIFSNIIQQLRNYENILVEKKIK